MTIPDHLPPKDPVETSRLALGLAVIAAVLFLVACGIAKMGTQVGLTNDDASYVIQARSLVERGILLWSPVPPDPVPAQHLPGTSVLLAPLVWLFPGDMSVLQWECTLFFLLGAVFFAGLALPRMGRAAALLIFLACLLSPASVRNAHMVLSDAPFFGMAGLLLWWGERLGDQPRRWAYLAGMVAGCAVLVRAPGVLLVFALVVMLLRARRFGHVASFILGVALPMAPYVLVHQGGSGYARDAATYWSDPARGIAHLAHWAEVFPRMLGSDFLGLPTTVTALAAAGGLVILALAVLGAIDLARREGFGLLLLFGLLYLLMFITWPYFEVRFYLPLWPIFMVLAASALRPSLRTVVLVAVLVCELFALGRLLPQEVALVPTKEVYRATCDWIARHTPPNVVIQAPDANRVYLWSGRHSVAVPHSPTLETVLFHACSEPVDYILVGAESTISSRLEGPAVVILPPRLDLWLDSSTLVRRAYQTPWDRLYRLQAPRARYLTAFGHFVVGVQMESIDPEESLKELDHALSLVPDMPNARLLRASLVLRKDPRSQPAFNELVALVQQYPAFTGALHILAGQLKDRGNVQGARGLMLQARARALAEERLDDVRSFDQFLQALPPDATPTAPARPPSPGAP